MRWKPVVVQSKDAGGSLVVTVGHPLADAYLEFLRARARPNTILVVWLKLDSSNARTASSKRM
jgi:hypothetical protein